MSDEELRLLLADWEDQMLFLQRREVDSNKKEMVMGACFPDG